MARATLGDKLSQGKTAVREHGPLFNDKCINIFIQYG